MAWTRWLRPLQAAFYALRIASTLAGTARLRRLGQALLGPRRLALFWAVAGSGLVGPWLWISASG